MRTFIPIRFLSVLLLAVTFSTLLGGVLDSAHAMQRCVAEAGCEQSLSPQNSDCDTPVCPSEDSDHDGCDLCCDCACHLSVNVEHFSFAYLPLLSEIRTTDRFVHLPEVFLSKFVPPQLRA
ncbi:hypothetical protein [Geomonas oryzae]|uniref:hypothetical protein n=1 Tax=Geomonas oryzae TaxID=2364273 RepID=UPI00100BC43C|nr:hypothetical protein [Geomonas oryzae]